jgi:hypothetical protein
MRTHTVPANAQALPEATKSMPAAPASPESATDEYMRLQSAKIVADVLFEARGECRD